MAQFHPDAQFHQRDQSRLVTVELDGATIARHDEALERERKVAMFDLVEESVFRPVRSDERGTAGPYRLNLSVSEGRLALRIADAQDAELETVILGLSSFKRPVRDYFAICQSYFSTLAGGGAAQIETVDMARRRLHDEGASLLKERLAGKIDLDFATARRLFTLICVLHIRA